MRSSRAGTVDTPPVSDRWWRSALALLFLAALGWKLFCLYRLARSPLFGELSADSLIYWSWAKVLVREGWLGHNPFFLGPLYPYLLALLHPVAGSTILPPLVVQCVLGATTAVLVAVASRHLCAAPYALAAGVLTAGCAMATFMELSVLSEAVLWFLGAVLVALQLRGLERPGPKLMPAACGALIGLMSLARPSFLLLLAPQYVSASSPRAPRGGLRSAAVALACALAVSTPVLARHVVLGHGWILNTYSLGFNAYIGNGPQANGSWIQLQDFGDDDHTAAEDEGGVSGDGRAWIRRHTGLAMSPRESSAFWLRQTFAAVQAAPLRAVRLLAWKAGLGLNQAESSQIESIHVYERLQGPFGLPWLGGFGVIGALGLFGLWARRQSPGGRLLIVYVAAVGVSLVLFFVTDRYRHHLTLPLLIACGPALEALHGIWRARGRSHVPRVAGSIAMLVGATALVWLPLIRFDRLQTEFDAGRMLGDALVRKGRVEEGAAEFERCLAPAQLARLPLGESAGARFSVASTYASLADAFARRERYAESERALAAALGFTPGDRVLRRDHALMLALSGNARAAVAEVASLGATRALLEQDLMHITEEAVNAQAWSRAEQSLRAAIDVDSTSEAANVVMLRLLRAQGREAEARVLVSRLHARGISAEVIERETRGLAGFGGPGSAHD